MTRIMNGALFTSSAPRRHGFTLVELLVVIGIIALVIALLLPVLARSRMSARKMECASQLRAIGRGFVMYANDNRGFVPRDHSPWRPDRRPNWLVLLGPYVAGGQDWEQALEDDAVALEMMRRVRQFHCAEHPLMGEVPGTYVVNAFKFESEPVWDPDGVVKLARVRNPSQVVLVAEAADGFGESGDRIDLIYRAEFHDAYRPGHLPRQTGQRLSDDRHAGRANLLFFDSSVREIRRGALELRMFDDGVSSRATDDVWDDDFGS